MKKNLKGFLDMMLQHLQKIYGQTIMITILRTGTVNWIKVMKSRISLLFLVCFFPLWLELLLEQICLEIWRILLLVSIILARISISREKNYSYYHITILFSSTAIPKGTLLAIVVTFCTYIGYGTMIGKNHAFYEFFYKR